MIWLQQFPWLRLLASCKLLCKHTHLKARWGGGWGGGYPQKSQLTPYYKVGLGIIELETKNEQQMNPKAFRSLSHVNCTLFLLTPKWQISLTHQLMAQQLTGELVQPWSGPVSGRQLKWMLILCTWHYDYPVTTHLLTKNRQK